MKVIDIDEKVKCMVCRKTCLKGKVNVHYLFNDEGLYCERPVCLNCYNGVTVEDEYLDVLQDIIAAYCDTQLTSREAARKMFDIASEALAKLR